MARKPVWLIASNMPELNFGQQTHSPKVPVKVEVLRQAFRSGSRPARRAASAYSGKGMWKKAMEGVLGCRPAVVRTHSTCSGSNQA